VVAEPVDVDESEYMMSGGLRPPVATNEPAATGVSAPSEAPAEEEEAPVVTLGTEERRRVTFEGVDNRTPDADEAPVPAEILDGDRYAYICLRCSKDRERILNCDYPRFQKCKWCAEQKHECLEVSSILRSHGVLPAHR
jgi:hypothetical protein